MRNLRLRSRAAVGAMALLAWGGCTGAIEEQPTVNKKEGSPAAVKGDGTPKRPLPPPPPTCGGQGSAPAGARLLTPWEYANSVRDLVGADVKNLIPDIPGQPSATGFDNEAGRTNVSLNHARAFKEAAEASAN